MTPATDESLRPPPHEWFYVREALPGVWMLGEPMHVNTWLVEGSERAVLLDTGLGLSPIRPLAESLTSKPLSVVNTHYHFDHIGGNHEFDDVSIHQIGVPLIADPFPPVVLEAYGNWALRRLEALPALLATDREFFGMFGADAIPRPFPDSFDPARWEIPVTPKSTPLVEGSRIDLGDRDLAVVHTPGHSPDGISLHDERNGLLFVGDSFHIGPNYAHFPDSDLEDVCRSAERLAEIAGGGVRGIMLHHYGRVVAEPALLRRYAEDAQRTAAGEVDFHPGRDILDGPFLEARFDEYSITVPDPSAPPVSLTET